MGTKERNECMNEIKLLQQMQHPHIICYLDCVIEQNELTVVMELVCAVFCRTVLLSCRPPARTSAPSQLTP